jgi:hypothetical protein
VVIGRVRVRQRVLYGALAVEGVGECMAMRTRPLETWRADSGGALAVGMDPLTIPMNYILNAPVISFFLFILQNIIRFLQIKQPFICLVVVSKIYLLQYPYL